MNSIKLTLKIKGGHFDLQFYILNLNFYYFFKPQISKFCNDVKIMVVNGSFVERRLT